MKIVVIGLGVQGRKRRAVAGRHLVATVDPIGSNADYPTIQAVPLASYDAACVCVPDREKLPILRYLLANRKHALVEKPLLAAPREIEELIHLSRAGRVASYTAYNHRFEPHIARLKQMLDEQTFGPIYLARLFYGNGTARDVRNSPWRDQGLGVIADLGSHLLDLALFLFDAREISGETWTVNRFENRAPDHVLFGFRGRPTLELEATFLSWRNTFELDVFGELGSAHMDCLCKWGPSTLTVRKRVLPSGRPEESFVTVDQPDPTWQAEHDHFLELCRRSGSNLENDLWIQARLEELTHSAGASWL